MIAEFTVYGAAKPQGNKTAFPFRRRNGKLGVSMTEGKTPQARAACKDWRSAVADAARAWQAKNQQPLFEGPLSLTLWFFLPTPKYVLKNSIYQLPFKKPDLSKLLRSVEDSLSGIIVQDDAQFVEERLFKYYAYGTPPRVQVRIDFVEKEEEL